MTLKQHFLKTTKQLTLNNQYKQTTSNIEKPINKNKTQLTLKSPATKQQLTVKSQCNKNNNQH